MNALVNEKELSLAELGAVLDSDDKLDYAVPAKLLEVDFCGDNLSDTALTFQQRNSGIMEQMPLTSYATDQLHARLSSGLKGVAETLRTKKLPSSYNELMRSLLVNDDRTFRVRTLKNDQLTERSARAIVSDRYRPIDDDVVFGSALPLIDAQRFQGIGGNKTELRTVAKFIEREASVKIQSGNRTREFHLGFILHNSEVGCGTASFSMFMSDSWCTNGCIFSKEVLANISYRHIGSQIDIRHGLIPNGGVEQAELMSIKRMIGEATMSAMSLKGQEKIQAALQASANNKIQREDIPEFIADLGKAVKLTTKEVEEIPLYMQNDERTQLGMQAAITALAQDKPYEQRLRLETIGGNVLMMNPRQWNALAVA